jgi:autotransporter-associated beta strand protein
MGLLPLRQLRQLFGKRAARASKSKTAGHPFFRPRLDVLEDRIAPATQVWSGANTMDGNWMTAANWVGQVTPSAGDDLIFPGGAARLTTNNNFAAGTSFNSITVAGASYTLQGNAVTLQGGLSTTTAVNNTTTTLKLSVQLGANQTFSSTYYATTLSLQGTLTTNGYTLTVDGSGTTTISGVISGSGSVTKNGPGTLDLTAANTYTGQTTLNAGIVQLSGSGKLGANAASATVNNGATLQLNNVSVAQALTLSGDGVGGGLANSAAGALQVVGGTGTVTGGITLNAETTIGANGGTTLNVNTNSITLNANILTVNAAGRVNLNTPLKDGSGGSGSLYVNGSLTSGTVNLTGTSTYTGSTTVHAGTLLLNGAAGQVASASFEIDQGATLKLDNTNLTTVPNRIPDTAAINLFGGTLLFQGSSAVNSSETVGTITLKGGHSTIEAFTGGSFTANLTSSDLERVSGATVNFTATNLGSSSNGIFFTSAPTTVGNNGGILPYATANNNGFATYDATAGVEEFSGYVSSIADAGPNDIAKVSGAEDVTANTSILGLYLPGQFSAYISIYSGVTLTTGALAGTSATVAGQGTLDVAGTTLTPGEGIVLAESFTMTISSDLASGDALVVSGPAQLVLDGTKSYTGGTILNSGQLSVNKKDSLGSGALTLVGGTFVASASQLTFANAVTLSSANATLGGSNALTFSGTITLTGGNTLTVTQSTTFKGNLTGTGSLTKLGGQTLTLSPSSTSDYSGGTVLGQGKLTIGADNSALGSGTLTLLGGTALQTTVSGGVTLSNGLALNGASTATVGGSQPLTLTGTGSFNGVNLLTLNSHLTLSGSYSGAGALAKSGSADLTLSGTNTYTGATVVTAGTLIIDGSQSNSAVGASAGSVAGAGSLGLLALASGTTAQPGDPGNSIGVLTAAGANLSDGGEVVLQVKGYGTAGVDYDRLDVSGNLLLAGGNSTLTLDVGSLTAAGTAAGVVLFGNVLGTPTPQLSVVNAINEVNNLGVGPSYTASELDMKFLSSPPADPGTPNTTKTWTGGGSDKNWSTAANWAGGVAPSSGDDLVFPSGAAQLSNNNDYTAGTTFHTLTFTGSGYTIGGNALTLSAGITASEESPTSGTVTNTINPNIKLGAAQTFTDLYPNTILWVNGTLDNNGNLLTVDGSGQTSLGAKVTGSGGITKTGTGLLELRSNSSDYTGTTTINRGIVNIWNNASLGSTSGGTVVNPGGMLTSGSPVIITTAEPLTISGTGVGGGVYGSGGGAISGGGITFTGSVTLAGDATIGAVGLSFNSNQIKLNGHTLTVNSLGGITIGSAIVDGTGGSGNLVINQNRTGNYVTLSGANTYTGTTVVEGGTLNVSGNGTLSSTSYQVNQGATLQLDNSGTNNTDRIPDTASITLDGGTFSFIGNNAAHAASSETVGTITLGQGQNVLKSKAGTGSGATATLTAASLVRDAGATLNVSGTNLGTSSNRILFPTAPTTVGNSGGILPYATFNDNDFATYDSTNGLEAFTGYVTSIASAGSGDTVKLSNTNETVSSDTTINALLISTPASGEGVVTVNPGATLTLASGGLVLLSSSIFATPTIKPGSGSGTATLNFGSEGVVLRNTGSATSFLNTLLTGSSGLTLAGSSGVLQINPPSTGNTYTGGTSINSGTLYLQQHITNPFGDPTTTVTFTGGNIQVSGPGPLTIPNPFAFDNGSVNMSNVTLTGDISLTGANNYLRIISTVTFTGQITGSGGLLYDGGGNLVLSPPAAGNTYSGGTQIQRDFLIVGNANSALGTGPVTFNGGILETNVSGGVTLTNQLVLNNNNAGHATLGSTSSPYDQLLTITGAVSLTGSNTLTVNVPVTLSGSVSGPGSLKQTGPSNLVLSSNNTYSGFSDVTGGELFVNGTDSSSPAEVSGGVLGGTGSFGYLSASNGGEVDPGSSARAIGTMTAAGANFSDGGALRLQIAGFTTAGTDYDRLDLGSNQLTLGETSRLIIDLSGLTSTGTASGVVLYGSRAGSFPLFDELTIVNNPYNFSVTLVYNADSIDVIIS